MEKPHLETIVIDGVSMKVYQDGQLKGNATLPRLVTDCTGDVLELGREGNTCSHSCECVVSVHGLCVGGQNRRCFRLFGLCLPAR